MNIEDELSMSEDEMRHDLAEDELLPCGCWICEGPLSERDAVQTDKGMAHEDCLESHYGPDDDNRDPGIPKG